MASDTERTLDDLARFELPADLVRPVLAACRLFNTAIDAAFYDVPELVGDLRDRDEDVVTLQARGIAAAAKHLDLGALANPEGSLLVIDTAAEPYIRSFPTVGEFLACAEPAVRAVAVATVTGIGSSALGSAAFGWNVSEALGRPVLAIVPGYGVADVVLQALGGWYGFGLHDYLQTKAWLQDALAVTMPEVASLGRRLAASAPGAERVNGAPVFRRGSGSSDVLHAILEDRALKCVVGHSKGALVIANALRSLPPGRTDGLNVVTLGCPIAEELPHASYHQYLGLFDAFGQLNAWGNAPDSWIPADHSTNTCLPLSMNAEQLCAPLRQGQSGGTEPAPER